MADAGADAPKPEFLAGGAGLADVRRVLRDHPHWQGVLAFNRFTAETEIASPLPGTQEDPEGFPRASTDLDMTRARVWLQESELVRKPSRQDVREALDLVAHDNGYDPIIDYPDGLARDGEERLERWLTTCCTVADIPYVRAVGRAWMVAELGRKVGDAGLRKAAYRGG